MKTDKQKEQFLKRLGEKIVQLRERQGMTQSQLADNCDKDKQSINRLERGNVNPSIFYLKQIADALGVELEELVGV